MDPPYYDNVMYAELADFFYVWEKRTLGRLAPEFFETELSDKDNEAVANPARFAEMGKRKGELAALDYQSKMTGIFAEAHRVLRDNGVMSVMFTHKRADAWDTLGASVLDAGFTIETSWPVNTEAEHSLHQANMNSAASTIMLVCRKRTETSTQKVFLEDIASEIRNAAADAVVKFTANGIEGVDLLLSTYGPVLSVVSKHYPVYSMSAGADGSAQVVRPEAALDIAREEVVRLQRARIVGADTTIDAYTDFVLIAWSTFGAAEFPFDDARRLAIAVGGLDVKELAAAKIVTSSKGSVRLLEPSERTRRGGDDSDTGVRIDAAQFVYMNDAIDTVLHIGQVDGFGQAKAFMDRLKLMGDPRFQGAIQGLVNAVPRTKVKGEWLFPQAGLLDTLVTAYFPDIAVPVDASVVVPAMQGALFDE
jgi:adenine-specific DNA methylase